MFSQYLVASHHDFIGICFLLSKNYFNMYNSKAAIILSLPHVSVLWLICIE